MVAYRLSRLLGGASLIASRLDVADWHVATCLLGDIKLSFAEGCEQRGLGSRVLVRYRLLRFVHITLPSPLCQLCLIVVPSSHLRSFSSSPR